MRINLNFKPAAWLEKHLITNSISITNLSGFLFGLANSVFLRNSSGKLGKCLVYAHPTNAPRRFMVLLFCFCLLPLRLYVPALSIYVRSSSLVSNTSGKLRRCLVVRILWLHQEDLWYFFFVCLSLQSTFWSIDLFCQAQKILLSPVVPSSKYSSHNFHGWVPFLFYFSSNPI